MIDNKMKISYNDKGSAIITALVVSTVVMVLCLSLLAISYSLFLSQKANTSDISNKEMFYSAIELFEQELQGANWVDENLDTSILPTDSNITLGATGSEFGKLILNSIWRDFDPSSFEQNSDAKWLYYDGSDHDDLKKCSKYFYLKSIGSVNIIAQLYWELPEWSLNVTNGAHEKWDGTEVKKEGTILHAIYRLYDSSMNVLIKTERVYRLTGTTQTIDLNQTTTNLTGKYKIVFVSKDSQYSDYVPDPYYFDNIDDIPSLDKIHNCEKTYNPWYNWYTDESCSNLYNAEPDESLFTDVDGQLTLKLYTDWGGNGNRPMMVYFIVGGKEDTNNEKTGIIKKKMIVKYNSSIPISEAPEYPQYIDAPINSDFFVKWCQRIDKGNKIIDATFFGNDGLSPAIKYDLYVFAMYHSYFTHAGNSPESSHTGIKNGHVPGHNGSVVDESNVNNITYISYKWNRIIDN